MSGTQQGALLGAAKRLGITADEYTRRVANGEKWCIGCKAWHPRPDFALDRSRSDGLKAKCRSFDNAKSRAEYVPRPRAKPGSRRYAPVRDGDKRQARGRVNHLVKLGLLPDPDDVPCKDCGHLGPGRRHEYDHHQGYAAEHHETVEAVCAPCHHRREATRSM